MSLCKECERENCGEHPWYFVARSYSHTDTRMLIKILTRRMKNKTDADDWKAFEESMYRKKNRSIRSRRVKFFVIQLPHDQWTM